MRSRFRTGCLTTLAVMVILVILLVVWLRRGAPLATEPGPAPIPGSMYFVSRDPADQLQKVYTQPADLSREAVVLAHRAGCSEPNCNIVNVRLVDGGLEYVAMHQGQWYRFRDGTPLEPDDTKPDPNQRPANAKNQRGSLVVDGQVVLQFRGQFDPMWAGGYVPYRWIGEGRYLIFHYSGFSNGYQGLLGTAPGIYRQRPTNFVWDRVTGKVHPFADGYGFIWLP